MREERRRRILEGEPLAVLLELAWPIMLYNAAEMGFYVVDAFFLGRLGTCEFTAPLAGWSLIMVFNALANGLLSSGVSILSKRYGSGDYKGMAKALGSLVLLAVLLYVPMGVLPALVLPLFVDRLFADPAVASNALTYSVVVFLGLGPSFVFMAAYYAFLAIGDSKTPSKYIVTGYALNAVLDPLLIFGLLGLPRLGVLGAALASVIAHSAVVPPALVELRRRDCYRGLSLGDLRPDPKLLRGSLAVGWPVGAQNALTNLGHMAFVSLLSRYGAGAVAAMNVANQVYNVASVVLYGFNRALSSAVGVCLGAGRPDKARAYLRKAAEVVFLSLGVMGALVVALRGRIALFFVDDVLVLEASNLLLLLSGLTLPFLGLLYVAGGVAVGSGVTLPYLALGVSRTWLLRVVPAWLLHHLADVGVEVLWALLAVSNTATGIAGLAWAARGRWAEGSEKKTS